MQRTMLDAVASGSVASAADLQRYLSCTLLAATVGIQARLAPVPPHPGSLGPCPFGG